MAEPIYAPVWPLPEESTESWEREKSIWQNRARDYQTGGSGAYGTPEYMKQVYPQPEQENKSKTLWDYTGGFILSNVKEAGEQAWDIATTKHPLRTIGEELIFHTKENEQERKIKDSQNKLDAAYEKAEWFLGFYENAPILLGGGAIASVEEYINLDSPSTKLTKEELAEVKASFEKMKAHGPLTEKELPDWLKKEPEKEKAVEEWMASLGQKEEAEYAQPTSVQRLTVEGIKRSFIGASMKDIPA